jgi:Domain of unknown function (DUF4265)
MNPSDNRPSAARRPATPGKDHVKVHFDLVQDNQGYPPATSESIWAVPLGQARFHLDNIPFFVCGVSCFDIISARTEANGLLKFDQLVNEGGHSTIRVLFYDNPSDPRSLTGRASELRNRFRELGCSSEQSHIPGLISIDIPPEVDITEPKLILDAGERDQNWSYEEANLVHYAP